MAKTDLLIETLRTIYNSTFMPIHLFENNELTCSFAISDLPVDLILSYRNELLSFDRDVSYVSTKEYLHVGMVKKEESTQEIIIGPVSSTIINADDLASLIVTHSLPKVSIDKLYEFYLRTPNYTLSQFLNILSLISKELTGKLINTFEEFGFINNEKEKDIGLRHSNSLIDRKENSSFHNTYYFEQEYYGYVKRGDVEGLLHFIQTIPSFTEGRTSADSIRQAKNIFIASTALITRQAIAGGLDIETAYQLSDSYIQEVEKMSDVASITALNATAVVDFTKRVSEAKMPAGMSEDIFRTIQFIANHVNQNISVADIAIELNMDRTTLSKKFKRELGFNISSYIMRRKLEEAKSLLSYTDKTISEISEYLCFSSQSYFQNVFKQKYGITSKEYRKQAK